MKVVPGYKVLKTLTKTNVSQIILVEKYGIKYVLKLALHTGYNPFIEREYFFLKYLYPMGIVPKPVAIGSLGKRLYFIREWMYGVTLDDFLKDKSNDVITEYFKETLYLLHKLHTSGIILRDISPSNFFVDHNGKLYILDVGFSVLYKEKKGEGIEIEGTPPYIAPESITGAEVSFKSDLYSIGSLYYYLYTGNLPYKAYNLDDLAVQQQRGLPPMDNIPELPRRLISQLMRYNEELRPTTLLAIKILNESPKIGQLLVEKNFPVIFSGTIDAIVEKIQEHTPRIINVFQSRYPQGFFSYIFKELTLRLEIKGYKTTENAYTSVADVILWHSSGGSDLKEVIPKLTDKQKLVVFSRKPLKVEFQKDKPVLYMNMTIRKGMLEENIENVLSIKWPFIHQQNYPDLPLYAKLNLKILEFVLPDDFPLHKDTLHTLSDYLYIEFHDIIDLLASYRFAIPKDIIYTTLLNKPNEDFSKIKEKSYTSLLYLLELMGFVEITETHIILLSSFDIFFRRNGMKNLSNNTRTTLNIYDELEDILQKGHTTEDIMAKIKDLLERRQLTPTHARIFLDRLYETVKDTETKIKLLKTKISLGFWKSAIEDWHNLLQEIEPDVDTPLFIDYIRLTISLGKYNEAVNRLSALDNPEANSLLLYAHALYTQFDKLERVLKEKSFKKDDPYYHIALGLYQLSVKKNTILAKNHAVRANELANGNIHAAMVSTYLYGISLLESGDTDRAISILESITGHEEYGIEALLVNFHLGYTYYRRNEFLKAIYYFEYSYYMARELNYLPLSVQAAFYLGYMYYKNSKLDLAEAYMDYSYRFRNMLSKEHQKHLLRNYLRLEVSMYHFDKGIELLKNNPEIEEYCDFITLARVYVAAGDEKKLKKLKKDAKTAEEKAVIDAMSKILHEDKKKREVNYD